MKGAINISVGENGTVSVSGMSDKYSAEVEPTEIEEGALRFIREASQRAIKLHRRSDNYLTICNEYGNDFCRLKATKKALWFSLDVPECFQGDSRLENVKNKNQRHWKIPLEKAEDIANYADIIQEAAGRDLQVLP